MKIAGRAPWSKGDQQLPRSYPHILPNHIHTSVHPSPRESPRTTMETGTATSPQAHCLCLLSHISWMWHQKADTGGACGDSHSYSPHPHWSR